MPRNYQYKDGIQLVGVSSPKRLAACLTAIQIFLILRDYLGDEHLGRACGVLYELIEVDCQRTDDKGAAFQRWKYDHMKRHVCLGILIMRLMRTLTFGSQTSSFPTCLT